MSVTLRYELTGPGWADCTIDVDGETVTASASYLSDALDDLAGAVIAVLAGDASASAEFAEEPGAFRWQFDRHGSEDVRVRVFWTGRRWNDKPHDPATPLFDATCRLRTLAGQLVAELQRILRELGEDGYRERWVRYAFPANRLTRLQQLLRSDGLRARGGA